MPAPEAMLDALERRGAEIEVIEADPPRAWAFCRAARQQLFAWWSLDPNDAATVDRERRIREAIGDRGLLRAPQLIEHGALWRIEPTLEQREVLEEEADLLASAIAAVAELPRAGLGDLGNLLRNTADPRPQPRLAKLRRRSRYISVGIRPAHVRELRAALEGVEMPGVVTHWDLRPAHVFLGEGVVSIIDWETTAEGPFGWDLLYQWAGMDPGPARDRFLSRARELAGRERPAAFDRLQRAAAVRMAMGMVGDPHPSFRDHEAARRLMVEHGQLLRRQ